MQRVLLSTSRNSFAFSQRSGCRNFSVENISETIVPIRSVLEAVKISSGLSWPVFIPLATLGIRAVFTAPFAIYSRICLRRQRRLQPLLSASLPVIKAQLAQTSIKGDSQLTPEQINILAAKERRKRRVELFKQYKCQNWRLLALPAFQIPVFVLMTLTVRSLALYDLSVITEFGNVDASSFLWLKNLVEPDSYGIFPLAVGACSLANIELNAANTSKGYRNAKEQIITSFNPSVGKQHRVRANASDGPSVSAALINISRTGAIIFMTMCFQAPMALQLYWLSSGFFSFCQNLLLNKFLPVETAITYPQLSSKVLQDNRLPQTAN